MAHTKICDSIYYTMSSKCYLLALSKTGVRILQQRRNIKSLVKMVKISMEIYELVVKLPATARGSSLFQNA
jgi:acetyl-CoA carboxylase beta subunit